MITMKNRNRILTKKRTTKTKKEGVLYIKDITHFLTHKVIEEIPSFMRRNEKQLNIKMCKNVDKQRLIALNPLARKEIKNGQNTIYMSRQCLRDGAKALILLGFLDGNVEFTPYLHLWKIESV